MKKLILIFVFISNLTFGQGTNPAIYERNSRTTFQYTGLNPKAKGFGVVDSIGTKSPVFKFETGRLKFKNLSTTTDTILYTNVLVLSGDSLRKMSRSYFGGGSATIDTTKIGRVEQGRGSVPATLSFDGVKWYMNDTSYIPRSGASNITGNLKSNQSYFEVGLSSGNNNIQFSDGSYSQFSSTNPSSVITSYVKPISISLGALEFGISNPISGYSRLFTVNGSSTTTPDLSFKFDKGIAWYNGDYSAQMETSQNLIPSLKKVKQLISDSLGTAQSTTLADGKIWIGDGTNTAFPRTLSGDMTVDNLGVTTLATVNSNVGTFGSATQTPVLVANGKGLITSVSNTTVTPAVGSITGLGTGVATWLATPSSANLRTAITDETGAGAAVFGTSPTFTTDITTPLIVGGTATTASITYKTTTGVGTTGSDHIFQVGNNGATEAMRISNTGSVGIGTTNIIHKLNVTSSNSAIGIRNYNTSTLGVSSGGVYFAYSSIATAGDQRQANFGGGGSDGTNSFLSARMQIYSSEAQTFGSAHGGYITLETSPNGTTLMLERVRINNDGNVGVGTSTIGSKLSVTTGLGIGTIYASTYTAPVDGAIIEGRVGIGTPTPSTALHVVGAATISTNATIGGRTTLSGGLTLNYAYKNANYTITTSEYIILAEDGITGTLPLGAGLNSYVFSVTNLDPTSATTLQTTGGEVFGNVVGTPTSITIVGGATKKVMWNSVNWSVIGN